ncbi:hypothetical protein H9Q70_012950 [Fusarium xylarioides]|nr:hypothetical protein H9Q70_012950 [Fusarium xylarioides]KAG5776698.1 hypothetical protein H9Q73_009631 [Fusarium xylarioides]
MAATPAASSQGEPSRVGLRFRPHDGSERVQERDFVRLWKLTPKYIIYRSHFSPAHVTRHAESLFETLTAAFNGVEQDMALDLPLKLRKAVAKLWERTSTREVIDKAQVSTLMPYQRLAGIHGIQKQLGYSDWFFMAAWLGPGHPFLESIRKDMSDLWGVPFPTDSITYPKVVPIETQMSLFYGKPASTPAPNESSIEERAEAIEKETNNSPVNGLSATITGHLPDMVSESGSGTRMQALETNLAPTNSELENTQKQLSNLD